MNPRGRLGSSLRILRRRTKDWPVRSHLSIRLLDEIEIFGVAAWLLDALRRDWDGAASGRGKTEPSDSVAR